MALTISSINLNPAGTSGSAPAARGNAAALKMTLTSVTIGVAGDYAAGGVPLTRQQLGMDSAVLFRVVSLGRTYGGAQTAVSGIVLVQTDGSVKIKLSTAAAEVAGAGAAGAQIDILAFGV